MNLKELNENQKKQMKENLIKDYYEWDNKRLFTYLIGQIPLEREIYRYSGVKLTESEVEQNRIIKNINDIVEKYNRSMLIEDEELDKLENYYIELNKYREKFYTSYNDIKNGLKFNKVFWINGPGGIGKSQFLYEFSEKLNGKHNYLCIYGKYCNDIKKTILNQIKKETKNSKFYFIIDAVNELTKGQREKILLFIKENKSNPNLRIILSYRDFSINSIEEECFKKIIDEEEIFSGISPENALEKISEKYNLDLSIYLRLLYDNNPLHLKLIIKTISENQLINKKVNSIAKGTYIYEQFIKKVLSKQDWNITKDIVEKMFHNRSKEIELSKVENVDAIDMKTYISKMKINNFIGIYEYENKNYLYFINETLTDYLIARFLFEKIKEMDVEQTIKYISQMLKVFYSIHSQIIMMLFEKYEKKIETAIEIVNKSELKNHFSIDIFNEISLNAINIKKIQKYIHLNKNISSVFIVAGGNESNPFNCINYLNDKLIKTNKSSIIQNDKYDILKIRSKLKVYIQTISKFDYEKEYLEEKFWFGVWASSSVDKINRSLSKKLIFEIVNDKLEYVDILISLYNEANDEYIKEMIIQVLCSQKNNITRIKKFLNTINTYEEVNIKNLYYISNYLYGYESYEKFSKLDLIRLSDKRKNKDILNFIHRVFFTYKYDYNFFRI